jgi:tetratricopeptide (TPR) repeat protein/DNA-binding CsgD family transcriptional regulator
VDGVAIEFFINLDAAKMIGMNKALTVLTFSLFFATVFWPSGRLTADETKGQDKLQYIETLVEEDPEQAIQLLEELIPLIDKKSDAKSLSKAWFLLGEAYFYLDRPEEAIAQYLKAVETDRLSGNEKTSDHISILGNIGYMYDAIDQKVIAMDYYEQALHLAREIGDREETAANLANIGQLLTLQGDYEQAILYMEEALSIDRLLGDENVIAIDLNTLARIYENWGLFDKAIAYIEEAMEIDSRLNNTAKLAIRYNSLGLIYKSWGKYEQALASFKRALEIDSQMGHTEKVALREANIGSTFLAMGQVDKAIDFLDRSFQFFRNEQMPSYMASSLSELGRAYLRKGLYGKAEVSLLECLDISRREGYNTWEISSLEALSDLYAATGRQQQSLEAFKAFTAVKDSVFNMQSQQKIAEFQAKYDLFKKQQENELLRKDKEIAAKRHTVIVLVFTISALTLLVMLLVLLIRLKIQQNKRLRTEKENGELRMELEQRNRELTYNAMCIIKNNETVAKLAETIEEAIEAGNEKADLNRLIRKLQHLEKEKNWAEFEMRFTRVHEDFYNNLNTRFPDLTPNERKLCAFLRLNMSTKDIAAITHQSVHSINVARTRMRKKLGIDGTDENLIGFLYSL